MSKIEIEVPIRIPGGHMMVVLTCPSPGSVPIAFISYEPDDYSVGRTRIRDQVRLVNALRDLNRPKLLRLCAEHDRELHEVLRPAVSLMDAPARAGAVA